MSLNKLENYIKNNNKLNKKNNSNILISHMAHWMYKKIFKYELKNNNNNNNNIYYYYYNNILKNKINKIYNNYTLLFDARNSFIKKYQEYRNELLNNNYVIRTKKLIDWFYINYKKYENEELTLTEYLMFEIILKLDIQPSAPSLYDL